MHPLDVFNLVVWSLVGLYAVYKFAGAIRIVPTRSAYIIERLGKYHGTLGPGFHWLIPFLDRVAYVQDLKEETMAVPPQECFTEDNVKVEVDGVLYLSVVNPEMASYGVTDYRQAAIQLAQTTIRSVIGRMQLDRSFEERQLINGQVVTALNEAGQAWGIRVHRYEVKNLVPPTTVKKSLESQVTAERERRAIFARSEGEKQSRINRSEGLKAEMVNKSEGDKQRRINEALGRAREIEAIAEATAGSIETLGAAISESGGADAVRLQLTREYLSQLGGLAARGKRVVLPADLTSLDGLLESVGLGQGPASAPAPAPARPPAPRVDIDPEKTLQGVHGLVKEG